MGTFAPSHGIRRPTKIEARSRGHGGAARRRFRAPRLGGLCSFGAAARLCRVYLRSCAAPRPRAPPGRADGNRGAHPAFLAGFPTRWNWLADGYGKAVVDLPGSIRPTASSIFPAPLSEQSGIAGLLRSISDYSRGQHPKQCRGNPALGGGARRGFKSLGRGDLELPYCRGRSSNWSHANGPISNSFPSPSSVTNGATSRGGRAGRRCGCCCRNYGQHTFARRSCGCGWPMTVSKLTPELADQVRQVSIRRAPGRRRPKPNDKPIDRIFDGFDFSLRFAGL